MSDTETNVKNRRAHERIPTTLNIQGTPEDGGFVARMIARNLSMGGLYCTSDQDFPEMTRLAVRLMLPLPNNPETTEPLDVEAVVVRREELPGINGEKYELALYFTGLEDSAKEQLQRFLQ